MVHRDVKPHNIMINSSGVAKLCDLGIAKLRTQATTIIHGRARLVGTPAYISPEQAQGEKDVDIRTDIYSLGATFYYLVTGSVPFPGTTVEEVFRKHLTENLIHPIQHNPRLSSRLNAVILKMMAKDKRMRYQSPTELIALLEGMKQPATVQPISPFTRPVTTAPPRVDKRFSQVPVAELASDKSISGNPFEPLVPKKALSRISPKHIRRLKKGKFKRL